jgi:hypothetical protein
MDMVGVLDAVVEFFLVRDRGHIRGVEFICNRVWFPATKDVSEKCKFLCRLSGGRNQLGATHQDVINGVAGPGVTTVAKLHDPHFVVRVTGMASVTASDIEMVKVLAGEIAFLCQSLLKFRPHDRRIGFLLGSKIIFKRLALLFGKKLIVISGLVILFVLSDDLGDDLISGFHVLMRRLLNHVSTCLTYRAGTSIMDSTAKITHLFPQGIRSRSLLHI